MQAAPFPWRRSVSPFYGDCPKGKHAMNSPLRILLLEDNDADAQLILRQLRKDGVEATVTRARNRNEFTARLKEPCDLALSDYHLPDITGREALGLYRQAAIDRPFIFVSGTIGEKLAIETLRMGASDYVLKDHLAQLGPAIQRALRDQAQRFALIESERALSEARRQSIEQYDRLLDRLAGLAQEVGVARDLDTVFRALTQFCRASMPCHVIAVSLCDGENRQLRCVYSWSENQQHIIESPSDASPQSRAVETGSIVATGNSSSANASLSAIAAPLMVMGRIIGAFEVRCRDGQAYGATHHPALRMASNLVAIAIENVQLLNRERQLIVETQTSEQRFRALIENSSDGIAVLDSEFKITYTSPATTRILGYTDQEIAGLRAHELIHPGDRDKLTAQLSRSAAQPGIPFEGELRVLHKNGAWRTVEVSLTNLLNHPGVGGIVSNYRDVTERKHAEEAVRQSESRFRQVVESNMIGILFWEGQGRITEANDHFLKMTGYSRRDLENGKINWREMTPPEFARLDEIGLQQLAQTGVCPPFEKEYFRRDGSRMPVLIGAAWLEGFDDRGVCFVLDITERLNLEQQLRQAQKMESIGHLAGGIAHDFNNILTVIQGHSSLIMAGDKAPAALAESAQQVFLAAERAANLTRQLLTFSRKQILQPKNLDLNEIVNSMIKMLRRILGEHISLRVNYAPVLPLIDADPGMMDQVLMNLAINSRDAMPRGGELTIDTAIIRAEECNGGLAGSGRADCVRLRVSDTGTGISTENLAHIFEPFFTTKGPGKGTGLGLATVYGIIQQHRGHIQVRSQEGHGATFEIYLPISSNQTPAEEEQSAAARVRGGDETILLVEDEPSLRQLVRHILEQYGYTILEAGSGVSAQAVWDEHKSTIDLLLTDMVMPDGLTGRDLAERLRQESPHLKVIFTSGYSGDVVGTDLELREGHNFLQKPYHPGKLAETIRDRLDESPIPVI